MLLLLLCSCLLAAAGRDEGAAGGSSGRFVSRERQACSWQLLRRAPGAAAGSELALSCRGPDGARLRCAYRGEPERCAAYAARAALYWKQVLGALRRRRPCLDPAPLRARLCAGKKGLGAELRLRPRAAQRAAPTQPRAPPQPAPRPAAAAPPPKVKPWEGKGKGGKRKAASGPLEERPTGTRPDADGLDGNAALTETYCAEKWHSLCTFFVNFWNG